LEHFQTSTSIAAKWSQKGAEDSGWANSAPELLFVHDAESPHRVHACGIERSRAWWRSVEHSSSGFVVESFIDELAAALARTRWPFV